MIIIAKRIVHKLLLNNLRKHLKKSGGVYIDEHFTVVGAHNISFGDSIYIGPNATLMAAGAPLDIKGHSVKEIIRAGPKKGAQNQPRPPRSFQGTSEKEEKFKQNQVQ